MQIDCWLAFGRGPGELMCDSEWDYNAGRCSFRSAGYAPEDGVLILDEAERGFVMYRGVTTINREAWNDPGYHCLAALEPYERCISKSVLQGDACAKARFSEMMTGAGWDVQEWDAAGICDANFTRQFGGLIVGRQTAGCNTFEPITLTKTMLRRSSREEAQLVAFLKKNHFRVSQPQHYLTMHVSY